MRCAAFGGLLVPDGELIRYIAFRNVPERFSEREKTAELLNRIIGTSSERSLVVIEHDMKFVENIANRVTVLHQGKVLAEGKMAAIKENPKVVEVYLGH